jgi:hypothetical protein
MKSLRDTFRQYTCQWFCQWKCHVTVRLSRFESLDNSVGKISWKNPRHHTVVTFQKNCIVHRRYGRYIPTEYVCWYIPTVSLMDVLCQYIPTVFWDRIMSVGKKFWRKNSVGNFVGFLRFSGSVSLIKMNFWNAIT